MRRGGTPDPAEMEIAENLARSMSDIGLGVRLTMMADEGFYAFGRCQGEAYLREAGRRLEGEDPIPTCLRSTYGCPVDHQGDESCQTL